MLEPFETGPQPEFHTVEFMLWRGYVYSLHRESSPVGHGFAYHAEMDPTQVDRWNANPKLNTNGKWIVTKLREEDERDIARAERLIASMKRADRADDFNSMPELNDFWSRTKYFPHDEFIAALFEEGSKRQAIVNAQRDAIWRSPPCWIVDDFGDKTMASDIVPIEQGQKRLRFWDLHSWA